MLTSFDKALLNILQTQLPITKRPFADLAKRLETGEAHVISRLRALKEEGYLRKVGPFFDSVKLGYTGTLVAIKVKDGYMERVALAINEYPGATHNYERAGEYNLWFTLLTEDRKKQEDILKRIGALPGVLAMMNLTAKQKYKINVQFQLE